MAAYAINPGPRHRPRKRFGQHFLHDPAVIARIVNAIAPRADQDIVEIGPGTGNLTRGLLQAAGKLQVIEIDRDLATALPRRCTGLGELRVHQTDVLDLKLNTLVTSDKKLRLVGNLPYNISTPLIFHLLDQADRVLDMVFMLQKEVAVRLAAAPGGRDYGRLSVMVQYRCTVERLFDVGPGAFSPPPKVDSTVVRLVPRTPVLAAQDPASLARVIRLAFAQRRKTLANALKTLLAPADLTGLRISPQARAETLGVDDFVRLANALSRGGF